MSDNIWIDYAKKAGYTECIDGEMKPLGHTELAIHTRQTDKKVRELWVRPGQRSYAFALLEDGTTLDGCLNIHSDCICLS